MNELLETLGYTYFVLDSKNGINVSLYQNKQKIWGFRKSLDVSSLSGLFKELYGNTMENLIDQKSVLDFIPKE